MRAIGGIVLALAAAWGLHVYGAGRIDGLIAVFLTALAGWAAGWLTGSLRPGRPPAPPAPKCPDMENQLLTLLKSPGADAEVAQAGRRCFRLCCAARAAQMQPGRLWTKKTVRVNEKLECGGAQSGL